MLPCQLCASEPVTTLDEQSLPRLLMLFLVSRPDSGNGMAVGYHTLKLQSA